MKKLILAIILFCLSITYAQQNEQQSVKQSGLQMLQPITVTVGGDFIVNGSFSALKTERLDHFITTVFIEAQQKALSSLNQIETIKMVSKEIERYALRDITLKRANGEIVKIDLLKFRLTGDFKYNPYLMNDDVIIFPSYNDEKNVVDISGAVNKSTKFQFVEGDKLSDAIMFAGGIDKAYAQVKLAEVSRLNPSGNKEELHSINISDDFTLQSGDRIRILAEENHKMSYKVLVLGEVAFPGYVYVTKDSTMLRDVILKAGGITSAADLNRAEFVRNNNPKDLLRRNEILDYYEKNNSSSKDFQSSKFKSQWLADSLSMLRLITLDGEDIYDFFNIDNTLRVLHHEQIVDFSKILDQSSDESKFLVRDGDIILIPQKFEYVYVFGQVPKVGYVKYSKGENYNYYIKKAGGLTETARSEDDVVIIKQKDYNWITENKQNVSIEPGDYIYAPKELNRSFWWSLSRVGTVISIIGSVATIILLLIKL